MKLIRLSRDEIRLLKKSLELQATIHFNIVHDREAKELGVKVKRLKRKLRIEKAILRKLKKAH